MRPNFDISVEWLSADHDCDGIRKTSALMKIVVGTNNAARIEDSWSQSVRSQVRVSAYPFALWIAASWWRLRWESSPGGVRSVSWRLAHECASAGHGFIWPPLIFESDGETVDVACIASSPFSAEPIHYLSSFRETVRASEFERKIDDFIALVLARLDAVGVGDTELHRLWREILEERTNSSVAAHRKLEAELGFEPDEASDALIESLRILSHEVGPMAVSEIACACAGAHPDDALREIIDFAGGAGVEGRLATPEGLRATVDDPAYQMAAPWERGRRLAKDARHELGLGSEPVTDTAIADMLGISASVFSRGGALAARLPVGLAVRCDAARSTRLLFLKRNRPGLRFEAARFLGDDLVTAAEERWLLATDARTARQKEQRAFAAEFLCPIDALEHFLGGDLSISAIEDAGDHFGVSPLAVRSHLANHGMTSPEGVTT